MPSYHMMLNNCFVEFFFKELLFFVGAEAGAAAAQRYVPIHTAMNKSEVKFVKFKLDRHDPIKLTL